jgi:hypothetical protein
MDRQSAELWQGPPMRDNTWPASATGWPASTGAGSVCTGGWALLQATETKSIAVMKRRVTARRAVMMAV